MAFPKWAQELFSLLDTVSGSAPIAPKVEAGTIKPASSLYYDLGIAPLKMKTLAQGINQIIDDNRTPTSNGGYLTTNQLGKISTIGELTYAVFNCL